MSVLRIRQEGDPCLRALSRPIDPLELPTLVQFFEDLVETAVLTKGCLGLSAPQLGRNLRAVVFNTGTAPFLLLNPVIVYQKGQQFVREGCLSVDRSKWGARVARAYKIRVEYLHGTAGIKTMGAKALVAAVIQHEIDHLNGILFTDKLVSDQHPKYTDAMRKADRYAGEPPAL